MTPGSSILEEIVTARKRDLELARERVPEHSLLKSIPSQAPPRFEAALQGDGLNIIAEVKYRSPSRGPFPCQMKPIEVARQYRSNGAAALSVLTEARYFSGDPAYLQEIRAEFPDLALLRKDFLLDPYQVIESRVLGASAMLAIVACLEAASLRAILGAAAEFNLAVLVEVHDARELDTALEAGAVILGVNNRNLNDFSVDLGTSFGIARRMEGATGYFLITESGLSERGQLLELRDAGFCGFLIGSHFMNSPEPGEALRRLLAEENNEG